jgi:cytochrome c oxidase subunit 4
MNEPRTSLKTYWLIWVTLMVLLGATLLVSRFNLGGGNTPLALLISLAKMVLVMVWFMHLRVQRKILWVFAGAGFLWLVILITLTMNDYVSRELPGETQSHQPPSFYHASEPQPAKGEIPGDAHSQIPGK